MQDNRTIYEQYQEGDFADRLFMFLQHRSLRDGFVAIDQRDAELSRQKGTKQKP